MKSGEHRMFEASIVEGAMQAGTIPEGMSGEQIEIFAHTMADVPGALARLEETNPRLVEEIRRKQEDVSDKRRQAWSDPDLRDRLITART